MIATCILSDAFWVCVPFVRLIGTETSAQVAWLLPLCLRLARLLLSLGAWCSRT